MTIPQGPSGRKIILDFADETPRPGRIRTRFTPRYILTATLLIASGFLAMAFLVKPLLQRDELPTVAPAKTSSSNVAASGDQTQTGSTLVHNGVTVVSPPLLVPVVSADAVAIGAAQSSAKALKAHNNRIRVAHRTATRHISAPWFNPTKRVARY